MRTTLAVAFALIAFAFPASAQDKRDAQGRRVAVIDMELEIIEASLHKPDHVITPAPIKREFRSLIRVRTEFKAQLLQSAGQL